jgi:hypothetical protein
VLALAALVTGLVAGPIRAADPPTPVRDPARLTRIAEQIRGASSEVHADGEAHEHGGMASLSDADLAYLGLRPGSGACAGMYELASDDGSQTCSHGLDVAFPDPPDGATVDEATQPPPSGSSSTLAADCSFDITECPSPSGWKLPTQIPCYSTGPYVEVLYVYWGTGEYSAYKERIRRSVASIDLLFKISAAAVKSSGGSAGNRHVRWAMNTGCDLKVTPVKLSNTVGADIYSIKSNLVGRKIITSSRKYLAFVDNGDCLGGIAELAVSSSKSSTNPSNGGGSLGIAYDCFDTFHPYAGYGANIAAHELMHTLGAVQYNAPHTTGGHCWDDVPAAHEGADIMCYQDGGVATSKFYARCAATYPETFDCGKDDYYNPYASASSYLGTHWNTASNKYLSTAEPPAWQTLPKPTPKFTKPASSGATIGGSTAASIAAGVPGIPISRVDWTVNGAAVDSTASTVTTLGLPTARTKTGGYANGTLLTIGAKVTDSGGLTGTATTKGTVWNPYIRLNTPAAFSYVSGSAVWSATASATGGRTVTKVELLVDGAIKSTDTTAPYGGTFTVPSELTVNVAARVTDSAGVTRQTPARMVFIPTVDIRFSAPYTAGAGWDASAPLRVPAGKTVPLGVSASSPIAGGIHHVDFKVGGSTVATDTTAPYSYDLKLSSTIGTLVEVTATGVDAAGDRMSTDSLWIKSVASFGSQSPTIAPNPAASDQDIVFGLVTTPPSGGVMDYACLYIDNDYAGVGCISPGGEETITVPASTFAVGPHVASWHLNGNTKADYSGDYWELDSGYARFAVTGAASAPTVSVTGLTTGTKYKGKVTLGATVSGLPSSAVVQSMTFYEGGRDLGTDYDAPFTGTWNSAVGPDGPRRITAVATLGDYSRLGSAGVDVNAVNTSVSLTAPANGATVSGAVSLSGAGVSDTDCVLESAAFLVDGVVVNTDRVAPFSYSWASTTKANGSHTVAMRMQLNDGRTLTTPAITVTVAN